MSGYFALRLGEGEGNLKVRSRLLSNGVSDSEQTLAVVNFFTLLSPDFLRLGLSVPKSYLPAHL